MLATLTRGALIVGGVATLLIGSVGFAAAQSVTDAAHKRAVRDDAATQLGVTGDQLIEALKQARKDVGVNQGQARTRDIVRDELSVAAKAIGLADIKALRMELRGSTLTAVAQKHNVAPATVAAAMKAD